MEQKFSQYACNEETLPMYLSSIKLT